MKIKRPYMHAAAIAAHIIRRLSPYCEEGRCLVAGSVRRHAPECGDIEIVCQPLTEPSPATDLFGKPAEAYRVKGFSTELIAMCDGRIEVGDPSYGRYCKGVIEINNPKFTVGPCQLDVFMPMPDDFFRQLVIRTGSQEFSAQVARKWVALGWRGTAVGLHRADQCIKKGDTWELMKGVRPTLPPVWKSEAEFFEWIGMAWVEPEAR